MITTSWTCVYDEEKMAVFKAVTFEDVGTPWHMGCFLNRELPIIVLVIVANS